jgi:predicted DNA-binding transcriptional regulator AlpA
MKRGYEIVELSKQSPDAKITVSVSDLIDAINYCIQTAKVELEARAAEAAAEKLITVKSATEKLGVDRSTLYRWRGDGYLKPVEIGGKRMYRISDINKIINKQCSTNTKGETVSQPPAATR